MDFATIVLAFLPMMASYESHGIPQVPHPQVVAAAATTSREAGGQDLSDAYYRRLGVHRAASYAMLPLFALQFAAGSQLLEKSSDAPQWAKVGHRVGATGVAVLFATNLVTGIPNLIEARREPQDRGRRTFHSVMMLTAAAGFTATGLLAERAEGSPSARERHRAVAYSSMSVATIGYASMLDLFRRD